MPSVNPRSKPDPRYDPANDAESAKAHGGTKKKKKERLEEIQSIVQRSLERARSHYEENLEPDQKLATDYYMGRPFDDEVDGRSKVVSTDIRDATHAQMPSLARIFFSPENAVEFRPRGPTDEPQARQMTDYIRYVVSEDNPGFLIFDSWFKDALVRRLGWVKWFWDEFYRVEATNYTGLDIDGLVALQSDEGVENIELTSEEGSELYDVRVTRRKKGGCPKFTAVPPEEMVFTPNARSLETAQLVAHVRRVTVEELIQLGIDEDLIDEAQDEPDSDNEDLESTRQVEGSAWDRDDDENVDPSQRKVLFAEAYCLIDGDDDKIAELRLFQCVGPKYLIANGDGLGEIVDEIPFAPLTPHPEPHTIVGLSNFDLLRDVQRVNSQLERGMLDSLAMALEPKTEVVEGEVNMADLMNPEINGIVRVRRPGMQREILHSFVGMDVLPVLGYFNEKKENRTGQTKAAQGLDADSLQSSTKAAVAATLSASQQRIEYIARVFAETGVKSLFKGLLRLVVKHQDEKRMVRLRDQYVEIDPRAWDASMDVMVNVGLGQGTPEDRIGALSGILAAQKEMQAMGSPLVSNVEIRATFARAIEFAGFRNPDQFLKPWGPQEEMAMQQAQSENAPPPDPQMLLVQIEQSRVAGQAQIDREKLELERWKIQLQDDREREKIARDAALKEYELELKHGVEIEDLKLKAKIQADRAAMDSETMASA